MKHYLSRLQRCLQHKNLNSLNISSGESIVNYPKPINTLSKKLNYHFSFTLVRPKVIPKLPKGLICDWGRKKIYC